VLLYLAFLFIMVRIHTFPLFIIRPMYLTMKSFKKALQDILQSRTAIHYMNTQYPDATQQDLNSGDNVCIICREEMATPRGQTRHINGGKLGRYFRTSSSAKIQFSISLSRFQ